MNVLATVSPFSKYLYAGTALAIAAALTFTHLTVYRAGRHAESAARAADDAKRAATALAESQAKAQEGFRRLEAQDANQRAQDAELAQARRDRDAAVAAADRLREQSAQAARDWAGRLADSPTRQDIEAAGAAIQLLTDVRSRLEHAGAELAAHADAARAAGLKCERDYDALTSH